MDIQSEINSNHVLSQVQELLINQTEKGIEKYGRTVRPSELSTAEWLDHASEEIIDLLVYLQVLKIKTGTNYLSSLLAENKQLCKVLGDIRKVCLDAKESYVEESVIDSILEIISMAGGESNE
ncbi:hypothetical protein [Metasolibacillus sp.]|uniref:hypothetical protein n=1 Tax=Metasolibacillus sp. TaxID=2703680 RepID=UPI0025D77058|nr:hypothetical protein [Metasolibacillus sp.]MCT6924595.1 hypothetical protein [Metasolibacillus sp.]MCT6940797.1 hypothetical protein [Metasolibacillus sp.]